ncbi:MAG: EMC3/TMCO1 family protein [Nanoarchaeota archaeon]|nr:EMC3/TMCO1 family protein [Nanoarchaeota archaeon]
MAFLDSIFNPVLLPLLNKSPFIGVLIISLILSVIVVLVYKYFTNQVEMKRIKEQQKEYQQKFKELKDKPEEMMKLQKEAMGKNFEYMKHTLKATLITMLPIILVFGWMNAHLAFEPIYPGETYSITAQFKEGIVGDAQLIVDEGTELVSAATQPMNSGEVTWNLKSTEGEHLLTVKGAGIEQSKKVLITKELKSETQLSVYAHSDLEQIKINYNKLRPLGGFEFFGWQPGWLGLYIFFSIIFSIGLRKVMNVY